MNDESRALFRDYFAEPHNLYWALLGTLAFCLGVAMLVVIQRAWHDRQNNKNKYDDTDVFMVAARALALLFITVAIFKFV